MSWARYLAEDVRGAGKPACLVRHREHSRLVSFTRPVIRSQGLAPGNRRRAWSIEPRVPPSGGDPAGGAFAAHRRQSPAPRPPEPPPRSGSSHDQGASCPRPLSAAPHASRALRQGLPRGEAMIEPRRRFVQALLVGPSLTRRASSYGVLPLVDTARRFDSAAALGLYALRAVRPYRRFTSGETLRRRNAYDPDSRRPLVSRPDLRPTRPSRSVSFRWSNSEPLRARPATARRRRRFCGSLCFPSRD
jgi:hypothetical protein